MRKREVDQMSVHRVTEGPLHHFFGYYDKSPWSADGRYLLAMENAFADRNPTLSDPLTVGVIDLEEERRFEPLAKTLAWNWQQGCMLKWMPPHESGIIGFNDLRDDHYVHVTLAMKTKATSVLPWALYDVSSNDVYMDRSSTVTVTHSTLVHTGAHVGVNMSDDFDSTIPAGWSDAGGTQDALYDGGGLAAYSDTLFYCTGDGARACMVRNFPAGWFTPWAPANDIEENSVLAAGSDEQFYVLGAPSWQDVSYSGVGIFDKNLSGENPRG